MIQGKYFDELELGQRFETEERTITEADLSQWVALVRTADEIFTNPEAARKSVFAGRVVPGVMTYAFAVGLGGTTRVWHGTAVAYLGTQVKVLAPVYVDDTIRVEIEVAGKKKTSKPDRGVVTFLCTVINQDGRAVLSYRETEMMLVRPESADRTE